MEMGVSEAAEGKKGSLEEINRDFKRSDKAVNINDRHLPGETKLELRRMIHQMKMENGKGIRELPSLMNTGLRTSRKLVLLILYSHCS
jgi:hypothetical protein